MRRLLNTAALVLAVGAVAALRAFGLAVEALNQVADRPRRGKS